MLKSIILRIGLLLIMQSAIHATENQTTQLLEIDRQFSAMSAEKGMAFAFDYYMADSATMLKNNIPPVTGREAINKLYEGASPNTKMTWEPIFADIAESNDLGYTIGEWTYAVTDSTGEVSRVYGHYVSIWKKQDDGSWKYVFDAGTSKGTIPHDVVVTE